jgi:AraC-like DNA-binding protein
MSSGNKFLFQLRDINRRVNVDVSLDSMAQHAGRSRFQFHRVFRRLAGETL